MIDVIKQTPQVYSKQSRDYQVLARLFTALYNLNKMYTDDLGVWDNNIDNKLTTLRAKTLNFHPKHSWDLDELDAAMSCFKYIMRKKGTIAALEFCLTILLRIKKLSGEISIDSGTLSIGDNHIIVMVPGSLASAGVVEDLFEYLLPAGLTYRIIEYKSQDLGKNITSLSYSDLQVIDEISYENMGIYEPTGNTSNQATTIHKDNVTVEEYETEDSGGDSPGVNPPESI